MLEKRECAVCGGEYQPKQHHQKYCCWTCKQAVLRKPYSTSSLLKSERVKEILKYREKGLTYKEIAEKYKISNQRVQQIVKYSQKKEEEKKNKEFICPYYKYYLENNR